MIRHCRKLLFIATVLAVACQMSESQAAPVSHSCGAVIKSRVKTETVPFATSSTPFVNVPGGQIPVVVPAGKTYCVKIRFSAQMRCTDSAAGDECFIRALAGANMADPAINGITFSAEDATYSVRSFQWIKELGAGTHNVRVQAAVQNAATSFSIQAWTLDVETSD
jgi:hypothetical protein